MKRAPCLPVLVILLFSLLSCWLTASPTSPSLTSEQTPTATALTASPTPPPRLFSSPEYGISLRYPAGWYYQNGDEEQELATFTSPNVEIVSELYVFTAVYNTLEEAAYNVSRQFLSGAGKVTYLTDEQITLEDGHPAWQTLVIIQFEDGEEFKVHFLTVVHGARQFLLLSFGPVASYDSCMADLMSMVASLHVETPALYGIPREQMLVLSGSESTNPRDHDPATTHFAGDKLVFSGLVAFDPQLNLVPDLAESWEVSPDGTVYTFHLRANARFHDGRPVTAQDVVYSWERAADPATGSDTVLTYLGDIVGVKERHEGKATRIAGLKVLDEHTLQVTIDAPKPYFLLKLTYPTAFVVDRANVESGGEWYRRPNGTGPYKLTRWERFKVKIYQANEDFYLGAPVIPYIVLQLYRGIPIRLYEAGEVDIASVYAYDVERVNDPAEPLHADLHSNVDLCTSYVVFDVSQPPFDDLKVRQAFAMAVDRQKYVDVVFHGVGVPAKGLYPPALPGYNPTLQGLPYDPQRARQLLTESKYKSPSNLPPIVYTQAGIGNDSGSTAAALAQMWEQNLGVKITIENIDPNLFYDLLYEGQHGQIFDQGWCADYPDPENFIDVLFHSGAQQNLGHYSNPELDALLEAARTERDVSRRIQLYQQAEEWLIWDVPAIFLRHSISYVLVKPYVQGYTLTPIDISFGRYLWLDWSKR